MSGPEEGGASTVTIERSDDLATIRALGVAAGLEDSGRENEEILAGWLARDAAGHPVGGVALETFDGLDVVNWMSVDGALRGRGVASRLLQALEDEARALGVSRLYATARAHGLFLANGYAQVPDGPVARLLVGECLHCPQYKDGCEPEPMVKDL